MDGGENIFAWLILQFLKYLFLYLKNKRSSLHIQNKRRRGIKSVVYLY